MLEIRRFDEPDEEATSPLGRLSVVRIGGSVLALATYEPGWIWSRDVGAAHGEATCRASHLGYVLRGRNLVTMDDGTEALLRAGDLFAVGPGHESKVVGDEPYTSLHLGGVETYAGGFGDGS